VLKVKSRILTRIQGIISNISKSLEKIAMKKLVWKVYCNLDHLKVYYINENRFQICPHVEVQIGNQKIIAVLDSGSEVCVL
jgi:hypothetical protein